MESSQKAVQRAPTLLRPSPSGSVRRMSLCPAAAVDRAAYFELVHDPARHFLRLRLKGVWDHAIFDVFAGEYLRTVALLARSGGVSHALVDATDFGFQVADITERFPALIVQSGERAGRTAIVFSALVNKVQAKRAGELLDARYFRSVDEATAWLFSTEA